MAILSSQRRFPFAPGTDYEYSSSDFFLLALAVERKSGLSLPEFAQRYLFAPCNMERTFVEDQSALVVTDRAVGHWDRAVDRPWKIWLPHAYMVGGGGLNTCIEDLYRWDQALRIHRNGEPSVLPRGKYMDEFAQQGCILGNRFNLDAIASGMRRTMTDVPMPKYRGVRRIFFTGGYWGLGCCFATFPDHDVSIYCLANNDDLSAVGIVRNIADIMLSDALSPRRTPSQHATDVEEAEVDLTTLTKYTGAYRRGEEAIWKIRLRNERLCLEDHLADVYELRPLSPAVFRPIGKPFGETTRISFQREQDRKTMTMQLSWQRVGAAARGSLLYERVQLADDGVNLDEFAGRYISPELNVVYSFRVTGGALWLRVGSRRWERLRPLVPDEFGVADHSAYDQRFFRFRRNAAGRVNELSVRFWRIRDLRFEKLVHAS